MSGITIAAAQSGSVKGDVAANIDTHMRFVHAAAEHHVDFIVFPELSLTGYEPELANRLQMSIDDAALRIFQASARKHAITIVVGAPAKGIEGKPYIAAFAYCPDGTATYTKHHLHPGEEAHFSPGTQGCLIDLKGTTVGLAICADTTHASHARNAARHGAQLYAAGVLISEAGYEDDVALLEQFAEEHAMAVVMANFSSPSGGCISAGKSAIWNERGERIVRASGVEDALVIARKSGDNWRGKVIEV